MRLENIIKSNIAISPRKAELAYDFVVNKIAEKKPVEISFLNIEELSSAFTNAFIGKLYMNLDQGLLDQLLDLKDIRSDIWSKKLEDSKLLGRNENLRNQRLENLSDLIMA